MKNFYNHVLIMVLFLVFFTFCIFADNQSIVYTGYINVCFSKDLVGNSRGEIEINTVNGIVETPFEWFNTLAEEFSITSLTRQHWVRNQEWSINGRYPMNVFRIEIDNASRNNDLVERLIENDNILFAELEVVSRKSTFPNDPLIEFQWALSRIQAFEAWEIEKGSPEIIVGIVDSGIKWNHEDLRANIWINEAELPGIIIDWDNGIITGGDGEDNDGNGFIDDILGWDFHATTSGGQSNNPFQNYSGSTHGTHVAGIVAAVGDNGIGIIGIAPNIKILSTKHTAFDHSDPTGTFFRPVDGIYYMVDTGAHIINNSWGSLGNEELIGLAVAYAMEHNVLVIAAAGNRNSNAPEFPASNPYVISVAATNADDSKATFSSFGENVNISAPGIAIHSTFFNTAGEDIYTNQNGTSMASPIVAGVAALMLSQNPRLPLTKLKDLLYSSVDPIDLVNPAFIGRLGAGRVNAFNSVISAIPYNNDIAISKLTGLSSISIYNSTPFTVEIYNNGWNLASYYEIQLIRLGSDIPLVSVFGPDIESYTSSSITLDWIPTTAGLHQIFARVYWSLDENSGNNNSDIINVFVLRPGVFEIYVGDPDSEIYRNDSFISYFRQDSITQTIYLENELELGIILDFTVTFSGAPTLPASGIVVDIYMTTTEKDDFENNTDWIPYSYFTKVFSGVLPVNNAGQREIKLNLTNPFEYNEGNLVVMAIKDHNAWAGRDNGFLFSEMDKYRTIFWGSDSPGSPNTNPFPTANIRLAGITNMEFTIDTSILNLPKPANLVANVVDSTVILTWEPSPIDFDNSRSFIGYNVYRNEVLLTEAPILVLYFSDNNVSIGTFMYYLTAVYMFGESDPLYVLVDVVSELEETFLPTQTSLIGNFPNPFNPETRIKYQISERRNHDTESMTQFVNITIYNIRGQRVRTLVNEFKIPGFHSVEWNGKDDSNRAVGSGIYLYRMSTGDYTSIRRMVLLK